MIQWQLILFPYIMLAVNNFYNTGSKKVCIHNLNGLWKRSQGCNFLLIGKVCC